MVSSRGASKGSVVQVRGPKKERRGRGRRAGVRGAPRAEGLAGLYPESCCAGADGRAGAGTSIPGRSFSARSCTTLLLDEMSGLRAAGPAAISVRDRPHVGQIHAGQLRAAGQSLQLDEEGGSQQLDVEAADELDGGRSEEHTAELQSRGQLVCRLRREKKK